VVLYELTSSVARYIEQFSYAWRHLCTVQLDALHLGVVRQRAVAVLEVESAESEGSNGRGQLICDRGGRPDVQRYIRARLAPEMRARDRLPAAFGADAIHQRCIVGPELLTSLLVARRDVTRRVHADRERSVSELRERLVIEVRVGREPSRVAADDREHEREP